MQAQHTVDGAPTPESPDSTLSAASEVPQRSARRATARRASTRRATARERKEDVEARILDYVNDHPHSTTGDIAKELNADRGTIAAGLSHLVRAGKITKHAASKWSSPAPSATE
jgi:predicted HTH transcriptional regulator